MAADTATACRSAFFIIAAWTESLSGAREQNSKGQAKIQQKAELIADYACFQQRPALSSIWRGSKQREQKGKLGVEARGGCATVGPYALHTSWPRLSLQPQPDNSYCI